MARIEKTVFISYRRADEPWALAVFENLTQHGYDVFIDYDGIASGNFATVILENIRARAHFLVLLTPTALERSSDPEDWMRREIEAALDGQRNIVPLMLAGFACGAPATVSQLTGKLAALKEYNGLEIPKGYFSPAMERLRNKFLSVSLDTVLHPASLSAQQAATEQKDKATMALGEALHQQRLSPEERRKQEETAARHLAEEERRQEEAETKQRADEEERRRKAEGYPIIAGSEDLARLATAIGNAFDANELEELVRITFSEGLYQSYVGQSLTDKVLVFKLLEALERRGTIVIFLRAVRRARPHRQDLIDLIQKLYPESMNDPPPVEEHLADERRRQEAEDRRRLDEAEKEKRRQEEERGRQVRAEGGDRALQAQIAREVETQPDMEWGRDKALDEAAARGAQVQRPTA